MLKYNDPSDWHGYYNSWLSIVDTAQSLGKDFIGGGHGIATDTNKMSYGKAAFLLKWNGSGRGSYYWMPTDSSDPWNPAWTTPIGSPSGAMYAVGSGWRRDYSGGTVIVNPNKPGGSSITFSLGAQLQHPLRQHRHQRHTRPRHRHDPQKTNQEKAEEKAAANGRSPSAAHYRRPRRQPVVKPVCALAGLRSPLLRWQPIGQPRSPRRPALRV